MSTQRPTKRVTQPEGAHKETEPALTAPEVLNQALTTLEEHVHLPRPPEADYGPGEIFAVLLYAAAHRTTNHRAGLCRLGRYASSQHRAGRLDPSFGDPVGGAAQ